MWVSLDGQPTLAVWLLFHETAYGPGTDLEAIDREGRRIGQTDVGRSAAAALA